MAAELDAILRGAVRSYFESTAGSSTPSAESNGFCLAEVKNHALQLVAQELSACLHGINAANRPSGLPTKLLAEVFSHLSVQDRFSASEVCRQWRRAAIQSARIWTDLREFGMVSPLLGVALERTGSLPVHLGLVLDLPRNLSTQLASEALETVLSHVTAHSHHLASLKVTLLSARATLPMLLDALTSPVPLLTELHIRIARESGYRPSLDEDLFDGRAPRLTRLNLHHILLPEIPIPALGKVVFLHLKTRRDRVDYYQTLHLMLPNLVVYEIDMPSHCFSEGAQAAFPVAERLQIVRSLRRCKTHDISLRPYARSPRLSMLEMGYAQVADIWESAQTAPTRVIALRVYGSTLLGGQNDAGVTRLFRDVNDYGHTADLLAHAAPHVRALVIDTGRYTDGDLTELAFPVLQYLHIVLPAEAEDPSTTVPGLLPLWVRAAELRTLRVDVPDHAADRLVGELVEFSKSAGVREPVFLELQVAEGVRIPEGFILRPPSNSFDVLGADPVDVLARWDEWLADGLAEMHNL